MSADKHEWWCESNAGECDCGSTAPTDAFLINKSEARIAEQEARGREIGVDNSVSCLRPTDGVNPRSVEEQMLAVLLAERDVRVILEEGFTGGGA